MHGKKVTEMDTSQLGRGEKDSNEHCDAPTSHLFSYLRQQDLADTSVEVYV
jgi:hypothetical protein